MRKTLKYGLAAICLALTPSAIAAGDGAGDHGAEDRGPDEHGAEQQSDAPRETRALSADELAAFESPLARLHDVAWLIGQWSGPGVSGFPASETWTAPIGGTMVGTFVQQTGEGAVMFTELMYLREVKGTLELALKHFNADLTGWEEKDEVERFRLIATAKCAAFFQGLTMRCANPEAPASGLVIAVRTGAEEDGAASELVFRYTPADGSNAASYGCDGTTFEINACLAAVRGRAQERERAYFETALNAAAPAETTGGDLEAQMRASQAAATDGRAKECGAVYEFWKEGTIRNAMSLRCEIRLIDQRTHTIWRNWLTHQDASAPILPKPGPAR